VTGTEGLTRADLASRLGVSVSALRKWEDLYTAFLVTPKGVKGYAAKKVYDPQDVKVLALVHKMRQEGLTLDQIADQLADRLATATEEVLTDLPTVPDRPQEVSLASYVDLLGRYQATEGQLESVTEERDYLRQKLTDMEDRLLDLQARAATAEVKLDLLQGLATDQTDEDKPQERPSFWARLFGPR
jgi:DNA-binding transcriptional MerR regulator